MTTRTNVLKRIELKQEGPVIRLANRPFLAGSDGHEFPRTLNYASDEDCHCYETPPDTSLERLGDDVRVVMDSDKGAVLIRGLETFIRGDNAIFGKLVDLLGSKFSYTAGFATRKEYDNAPGTKCRDTFAKGVRYLLKDVS